MLPSVGWDCDTGWLLENVVLGKVRGQRPVGRCPLGEAACGVGYLTAPAVRPAMIRRWKIRTTITRGTVTRTPAAILVP